MRDGLSVVRSWVRRHPMLRDTLRALVAPMRGGASRGYRRLTQLESSRMGDALRGAWQSRQIPLRQRRIVDEQLAGLRRGVMVPAFEALVRLVRELVACYPEGDEVTLVEIGCSSGYHAELLQHHQVPVQYAGYDYSSAFIELARAYYPDVPFGVADATALPMRESSVDIVLSGCCLLHIPDYEAAIRESARIARRFVVFHRTPVLQNAPTRHYRKRAYDVETIEIHFNEEEFVSLLARYGLTVRAVATLDVAWESGASYATKEYVCEKRLPTAVEQHVAL